MPALKNPMHEAAAQFRAQGKTQDEAYKLAGFKPHRQNAHRLMTRDYFIARIAELQGKAAQRAEVTIDTIAAQLDEDRRLAYECKNPSAAVAATIAKAKLFGLGVERSVVNVTHNYAQMTEAELRDEIASIHAEARAIKSGVQH